MTDKFESNQEAAEHLKKQIINIAGQKAIMDGYKEKIREDIKATAAKHLMKPKVVAKMVDAYYKQNIHQQSEEFAEFSKLYDVVIGT